MLIDPRVSAQVDHEIRFCQNDPFERPEADTVENFVNKAQDAAILHGLLVEHATLFQSASRIVEVGGGQGWGACLVKRMFPSAHVTLTDAVDAAVRGARIWERVFDVRLDAVHAAPAQHLPIPDASVDLMYCFAAAHHFVDHGGALAEVHRVLRAGGHCLWFYEPTSPSFFHAAAERRVNRKRPDVPEHVLVPSQMAAVASTAGLQCTWSHFASTAHRGPAATAYYLALRALPPLRQLLPCTANFMFTK